MNSFAPILWLGIIGAALGGLLVLIFRKAATHRKELQALASELGYTYEPEAPELLDTLKEFRLFLPHRNRFAQIAFNVLKGQIGSAQLILFDYSFQIRGSHSAHDYAICTLRAPELRLPYFYLRHRHLMEPRKSASANNPGLPDSVPDSARSAGNTVDFPEDGPFDETFVLCGKEAELRPCFDAALRQHLLPLGDIGRNPASLEGYRDTFMLVAVAPIDAPAAKDLINRALDLLPLLCRRGA